MTSASRARCAARSNAPEGIAAAWLCVGTAVAAVVAFWLVRGALIDDAYITLAYARNLAAHGHWGLIPTETANSATSPLNVLLLGGATALLRPFAGVRPLWGLGLVFVGTAAALAWWWVRIAAELRLPTAAPVLGVALVLLNPFVLSATGLEVLLIPAVLTGMLAAGVRGRPMAFGVLAGLALLTRVDLIVFVVPMALASAGVRKRLWISIGAAMIVALPWFAWSWWTFGSAIPDTFVIKTLQRSFGQFTYLNGMRLYWGRDALATGVTVAPAVLGFAATLAWAGRWLARRGGSELLPAAALAAGGVGYFGVYVLLGVPPYQWYYVPTFAALATSLCVFLGAAGRDPGRFGRVVGLPGLVLACCLAVAGGAADVRDGVPWSVPVIFGNWATPADYAGAGRWLGARVGSETVIAPPEIGTLAYYCRCSIVDAFADRGRVLPLVEQRLAAAGPVARLLLEVNYRRLDRDLQPRPARFQLVWEPGPATGADQWQTWSPATGVGHLRLIDLSGT